MELILDIFWERQKAYIAWKQAACAAALALVFLGLYNLAGSQQDLAGKYPGEAVLPGYQAVAEPLAGMIPLPGEDTAAKESAGGQPEAGKLKESADPDVAAGKQNYAVSYGGMEDAGNRKKVVSKSRTGAVQKSASESRMDAVQKAERGIGKVNGPAPVLPGMEKITGNTGILTDREEEGSQTGEDRKESAGTKEDKNEYSGIKEPPATVWERFPGFLADDKGRITGFTDPSKFMKDNLVVLPVQRACTGIEKGAFKGIEPEIFEIYIPANITYIAPGAFDVLPNLYYIEAAGENSVFYSKDGVLYYKNGKVAAYPERLK